MNLMHTNKADYIVSGSFAGKAAQEGAKYGAARVVKSSKDRNFAYSPNRPVGFRPGRGLFAHHHQQHDLRHKLSNRPSGLRGYPACRRYVQQHPFEPYDVRRFGLIYAGAQKNIGPAG